jgi:VIT1/CCC1 family predicted Fe2+/Mn2+ transporter
VDRSSEVLFGLVMALTFTSTFEVATAGQADVRTLLIGAFGCNLAWGIVDGVMFVVTRSIEKHRLYAQARAVQTAAPADAVRILEQELPAEWASLLEPEEVERLARRLRAAPVSLPPRLTAGDLKAGLAVFLLVLLSTLPVTLPFLLFDRLHLAARVSDAIALVMLLAIGARLGRHAGRSPVLVGLAMMVIGVVLSAAAIRFGG